MSARKSLSVSAAIGAAFPMVALAQDAGRDAGSDAGPSDVLFQNQAAAVDRIWAELSYEYQFTVDAGPVSYDYDSEPADDFIVPEGPGWSIERVFLSGFFSGADTADAQLSFSILKDNSGLPGAPVSSPACRVAGVTPVLVGAKSSDVEYELATPCWLAPGHYWLAIGVDSATTGDPTRNFFYANMSARPDAPAATDYLPAFRSNCRKMFAVNPGLPAAFEPLSTTASCKPMFSGGALPYPNLDLKFGLFGTAEGPPPEPDAGTPDAGAADAGTDPGAPDSGAPDAGTGGLDAGRQPDAGEPPYDDEDGGVDEDGELSGGGCNCSVAESSGPSATFWLGLGALGLWFTRRRRKSAGGASNDARE